MNEIKPGTSGFHFPDLAKQGNRAQDQILSNVEEIQQAVLTVSKLATRRIRILSHDLEPMIYDQQALVDNILALARGNRHATVQILVADSLPAVQRGHALIRLARKLTSALEFRILPEDYSTSRSAFMLADQCAFVFRSDYAAMQGILNPQCEFRSKILADEFERAWETGQHDPQTKNIYI